MSPERISDGVPRIVTRHPGCYAFLQGHYICISEHAKTVPRWHRWPGACRVGEAGDWLDDHLVDNQIIQFSGFKITRHIHDACLYIF